MQFGGTPAISFVVNSSNQITAVVPAGSPGPAAVTVTTAGGTSNPVTYRTVTMGNALRADAARAVVATLDCRRPG